jgi:hypothetical protein
MPYTLSFSGGFFQIADFMQRVDAMVHTRHGGVVVEGRLLTVDAFTLSPVTLEDSGTQAPTTQAPQLTAELSVTTYLTPAEQGTTAGATPTGPAPATATPASTTTAPPASSTSAPTSTTSP